MLTVKDDDNVFDVMFAFMAKSDDKENEEKLRNPVVVLIDSITELTTEKDSMNNNLDNFNKEKLALTDHVSVIEEQLTVLETENLEIKEKLKMLSEKSGKGK
ncbi:hypothetical protein KY284_016913 [Solanum tuberosum]|nr:hypothetical protein KY284_016913 [Solanum tuberosum]